MERFLSDTDPSLVNLCLDTGHISYCDGNNIEIIERFPERITYVHLKQVEPEVRERVRQEKLSLAGRFGLQIYYPNPTFEEYHAIVRALAREADALDVVVTDAPPPVDADVEVVLA